MRCEELMKRNIECLKPTESAQIAARKMRDSNIGFLPICDDKRKVLGTITDRDLAIRLVAEGLTPERPISQIMTPEVVSCLPSADLDAARELMAKHHKSRILCCDENQRLVGVISLSDIAQVSPQDGAATLRAVSGREASRQAQATSVQHV